MWGFKQMWSNCLNFKVKWKVGQFCITGMQFTICFRLSFGKYNSNRNAVNEWEKFEINSDWELYTYALKTKK
ncbi:hypothetical protein CW304_10325 [Bacillus sp. UFRGS-B20]|nr:hypothetical protein CW304_10325 [Bacillus sp. UFRGS-B20]